MTIKECIDPIVPYVPIVVMVVGAFTVGYFAGWKRKVG